MAKTKSPHMIATRNVRTRKEGKTKLNNNTTSKRQVKCGTSEGAAKGKSAERHDNENTVQSSVKTSVKRKIKSNDMKAIRSKRKINPLDNNDPKGVGLKVERKIQSSEKTSVEGANAEHLKIEKTIQSSIKTSTKRKIKLDDMTVTRSKRPRKEKKTQSNQKITTKRKVSFHDTEEESKVKRPRKEVSNESSAESKESGEDFGSDDSVSDPLWCPNDSSDESDTENLDDILEDLISLEEQEDQILNEANVGEVNDGWSEFKGRQKSFTFNGLQGLQKTISSNSTPLEIFRLFLDDEVINHIVLETNRYAEQTIASKSLKTFARLASWRPTTAQELKKIFGLLIWMGLVRLGTIAAYWEVKGIYRQTVPRSVMSRNRFQALLSMLHFSDNETSDKDNRLAKIQPLVDILESKFKDIFHPGVNIVIDETLVPWRGRLIFRQFLPLKAHKYGVKLFKLCSSDGYTWGIIIYSGKSTSGSEVGLALRICQELTKEIVNEGRTLYIDNFYTSYDLAKYFITNKTHVVGTFRANMKGIPKEVLLAKLKKGEVISREDENGIVVLKWKDARDVRILSTKHAPTLQSVNVSGAQQATDVNSHIIDLTEPIINLPQPIINSTLSTTVSQPTQSVNMSDCGTQPTLVLDLPITDLTGPMINSPKPIIDSTIYTLTQPTDNLTESSNSTSQPPLTAHKQKSSRKKAKAKSKSLAVLAYNKGKVGVDLSDQMGSYATTLRKGVKWYRKLGIELILGTSVVNSWVVYNRIRNKKSKVHIRSFRESLAADLLDLKDENQNASIKSKDKSHHLAPRFNSEGQKVRRKCARCYSKLQQQHGRAVARKRAKMVLTFCEKCPGGPQFCLNCFNLAH